MTTATVALVLSVCLSLPVCLCRVDDHSDGCACSLCLSVSVVLMTTATVALVLSVCLSVCLFLSPSPLCIFSLSFSSLPLSRQPLMFLHACPFSPTSFICSPLLSVSFCYSPARPLPPPSLSLSVLCLSVLSPSCTPYTCFIIIVTLSRLVTRGASGHMIQTGKKKKKKNRKKKSACDTRTVSLHHVQFALRSALHSTCYDYCSFSSSVLHSTCYDYCSFSSSVLHSTCYDYCSFSSCQLPADLRVFPCHLNRQLSAVGAKVANNLGFCLSRGP